MNALIDESLKLVRSQQQSQLATSTILDQMIMAALGARRLISEGSSCVSLNEDSKLRKEAQSSIKDFHVQISKLAKAHEDCKAINTVGSDDPCTMKGIVSLSSSPAVSEAMNIAILEHLCRTNQIEAAEVFASEVGISVAKLNSMKQPYLDLHIILDALKRRDLGPASSWAEANRSKLPHKDAAAPPSTIPPSFFEFRLLQLHFVATLKANGRDAALSFARGNFEPFAQAGYPVHRLMGLLAIGATTELGLKRYADLLSSSVWEEAASEFSTLACGLMGQSKNPPLLVAVAAGSVALPPLLKLGKVMEQSSMQQGPMAELPVELDLGTTEFIFHSIFACPVTKEQATPSNPPCLLPCGHMLCEESIMKIVRARTRTFKCPYCPVESKVESLVRIFL